MGVIESVLILASPPMVAVALIFATKAFGTKLTEKVDKDLSDLSTCIGSPRILP